jgi:hypothetical protein
LLLELVARKADNFLNSTFSNLPCLQEMEEPGLLEISAADVGPSLMATRVRVFHRRGETAQGSSERQSSAGRSFRYPELSEDDARISEHQQFSFGKADRYGNSATFYSVLVEVELYKPVVVVAT